MRTPGRPRRRSGLGHICRAAVTGIRETPFPRNRADVPRAQSRNGSVAAVGAVCAATDFQEYSKLDPRLMRCSVVDSGSYQVLHSEGTGHARCSPARGARPGRSRSRRSDANYLVHLAIGKAVDAAPVLAHARLLSSLTARCADRKRRGRFGGETAPDQALGESRPWAAGRPAYGLSESLGLQGALEAHLSHIVATRQY
jgi:hypothetical protein